MHFKNGRPVRKNLSIEKWLDLHPEISLNDKQYEDLEDVIETHVENYLCSMDEL